MLRWQSMGNLGYGMLGMLVIGLGIWAIVALFTAAPWWAAVLILLLLWNL